MRGHKSFIAFDHRPNPLVLERIVKSLTIYEWVKLIINSNHKLRIPIGRDVRVRLSMEGEAMVLDRRWRDRRGLLIGDGGRR